MDKAAEASLHPIRYHVGGTANDFGGANYLLMNVPNTVLQKENLAMAFGTPISTYLWPDSDAFNAELKKVILQKEKVEKGITRSNVGGWHSKADLLLWEADCIRQLKDPLGAFAVDLTRLVTPFGLAILTGFIPSMHWFDGPSSTAYLSS